eukprot:gene4114-14215_t
MPITEMLLRTLLLGGPDPEDAYAGHDDEEVGGDEDSTLGLRIGAIFAILAAGLIGGVPPLIFTVFQDQGSPMSRLLRSFAGGIILALALVHIIPEGLEQIDSLAVYTYGGPIVAAGVIFMIIVESSCNMLMPGWLVSFENRKPGTLKQQVSAYMFELGCVTHSLIIGLMLGTQVTGQTAVIALIIALCFHQAIEGLSLGSSVATAGFSRLKSFAMILTYGLTVPIGTAVGIAVASTYDDQSITAIAIQGVLNCLSGGMLLYIALIQLLAEEFSREDKACPVSIRVKLGTFAALIFGVFCMCLLANWA